MGDADRIGVLTERVRALVDGAAPEPVEVGADDALGKLEEQLNRLIAGARQRQQERLLFSVGPVVLFRWKNAEGWPVEYVSDNVSALTGYPFDDFASGKRAYASVIHPDDLPQVFEEVTSNSKSGVAWFAHQPYRIVRPDASSVWVSDYTVVLRDEAGTISHYFGYIMDISAQVEQLSRLHAHEQALEKLSNPILQVARGVLAMPVMGSLGGDRPARMTDELLNAIARNSAHTAVLDLTGMDAIEDSTVDLLVRMGRAVQMLGCRCILSGIAPSVAMRVVQLGLDTKGLITVATLQNALERALSHDSPRGR